jgi:hypothetical protein
MLVRRLHECNAVIRAGEAERGQLRGALAEADALLAERDRAVAALRERIDEKERRLVAALAVQDAAAEVARPPPLPAERFEVHLQGGL